MRRTTTALAILAFFFGAALTSAQNAPMTPTLFVAAYEDALASQNWEVVAPLIHDDCVATFTSGTYRGKKEVELIFRRNFASIKSEHYAITNVHWVKQSEGFAVFTFDYQWSGVIGGKSASGGGRGSSVIMKSGTGWQLLSEHLGPPAPKQP
jgi:ketosteroid isomerase-like protein